MCGTASHLLRGILMRRVMTAPFFFYLFGFSLNFHTEPADHSCYCKNLMGGVGGVKTDNLMAAFRDEIKQQRSQF